MFFKKKKKFNIKRSQFVKADSKKSFIERKRDQILENLEFISKVNLNVSYRDFKIALLISSVIGFVLGLIFKNIFLSVVLMASAPLGVIEYLRFKREEVSRYIDCQVIKHAELIKNSYLHTQDIKESIRGNIKRFSEPIKTLFEDFIKEVDLYNYSIEEALERMVKKIDSKSLDEFKDQLVLCNKDRRYAGSLTATVNNLNDKREFMEEWIFLKRDIIARFMTLLIFMNLISIAVSSMFGEVFTVFLKADMSKPIIAIYVLAQILTTSYVIKKVNIKV